MSLLHPFRIYSVKVENDQQCHAGAGLPSFLFPEETGTSSSITRDEEAGNWLLDAGLENGLPGLLSSGCTRADWVLWEGRTVADFGLKSVIPFSSSSAAEEGEKVPVISRTLCIPDFTRQHNKVKDHEGTCTNWDSPTLFLHLGHSFPSMVKHLISSTQCEKTLPKPP